MDGLRYGIFADLPFDKKHDPAKKKSIDDKVPQRAEDNGRTVNGGVEKLELPQVENARVSIGHDPQQQDHRYQKTDAQGSAPSLPDGMGHIVDQYQHQQHTQQDRQGYAPVMRGSM